MRVSPGFNRIFLAVILCANLAAFAEETESIFDTKTKVRLAKGGVWLEAEISPRALLTALPNCDRNQDQRLDEDELSQSHGEILNYFATKVHLAAANKKLHADSTYFAFRSPATPAALPDRFYIYHWYAMLRRPEKVEVRNELFTDLHKSCHHQGAFISGEQRLQFDFADEEGVAVSTKAFQIASAGEVSLVADDDDTLQAGYVWAGLGIFGFVFFRLASAARNKWSHDTEEEDEEEEVCLTHSAVLN